MHDIDFLPIEYRQKHARRQSQPWQIVVAVAIVGLVAAAALAQQYRRHRAESDLAMITPVYDAAIDQQNRLAEVQKREQAAKAGAELYTYLRHPWPRTQLLAALMAPLPDAITLQQIHILRETPTGGPPAAAGPPVDKKTEEEQLKSLPPAQRDFLKLTDRLDRLQTVVILTGTATEAAALHRYIGDLDATDIFDKAELDCFNSIDNNKSGAVLQFRAVLAVQPGYGQPGGPTGPGKERRGTEQDAETLERLVFSCQFSVVSYQLSVISYHLSVVSYTLSVIRCQFSPGVLAETWSHGRDR